MKSLVIFDLDGTLLNTIADLGAATNHALRECGFPEHSLEAYTMMVGNGVGRLLERALPDDARTPQNVELLRAKFTPFYNEHCTDLTEPYAGIPELLESLDKIGVRMAVASNKYVEAADHIIRHYFPTIPWVAIEGQREGVPLKPDPSCVFAVLAQCPTPKQDVLFVGDSGTDMETARRACVDSAGVTWGFRPVAELEAFQARHIVRRPVELLQLLRN